MKKILDVLAGYILAVFAAALVIVLATLPFGTAEETSGPQQQLADHLVFWISVASRIAIAASIPAIIGVIISNITGLRSAAFYCLWGIATAIGLSLISAPKLSLESLLTLIIAGLVAGLAFRVMNSINEKSRS